MPKLEINGEEVEVEAGLTLLQACEVAGAEIPRFCYHERLSIAGNCRMCLVEVEKSPKPVASCAMPVADGMVVRTDTPLVKKAREGVMEFLLINHPLDCPICDQGGECDLQDQAMAYGIDRKRFEENKRAVDDKNMGPLINTIMTRCIHCTRCVRFSTEVAGVEDLGAIGRGEDMEITTYLEQAVDSELSGNVIDLCPVGALTSKPYSFAARSWELRKTESIDVMDAVGSNVRVDARGRQVMRVLPRLNEDINEEWISDKTRFACDGLQSQRLDKPYVRRDGKLEPATWDEAFAAIKEKLDQAGPQKSAVLVGDLACTESIKALKDLWQSLGSPHIDCRTDGTTAGADVRGAYLFNSTIAGIDEADALLLIGTNPRWEAPIVNARIRRRYRDGNFPIANIGPTLDLTYPVQGLGAGPQTLFDLIDGAHSFIDALKHAHKPMIIVGTGALSGDQGDAVLAAAIELANQVGALTNDWNGFNVLQSAASRVAALDLGVKPAGGGRNTDQILEGAQSGDIEVVYLLSADEREWGPHGGGLLGDAFVIYQGSHGDCGAHRADVILPGAAYTEKDALWVNTEGRVQAGQRAVFPPGDARDDWAIIRALSDVLGQRLPYDSLQQLRAAIIQQAPHFGEIDAVHSANVDELKGVGDASKRSHGSEGFSLPIHDFYLSNPIARASKTMAECSALFVTNNSKQATGTHG